jgi:uncharacterized membrane protein
MLVIIGMAALAVDIGFLYSTRRNMQTAADAAAIAGSNALKNKCGTDSGCTCESESVCKSAAQDVATLNGFIDGTNSVTVTVKTPAAAPSPTNGVYVEADVTELLNFSGGSAVNTEQVTLDAWKMNITGGAAYIATASSGPGQTPPVTTSRLYQ